MNVTKDLGDVDKVIGNTEDKLLVVILLAPEMLVHGKKNREEGRLEIHGSPDRGIGILGGPHSKGIEKGVIPTAGTKKMIMSKFPF